MSQDNIVNLPNARMPHDQTLAARSVDSAIEEFLGILKENPSEHVILIGINNGRTDICISGMSHATVLGYLDVAKYTVLQTVIGSPLAEFISTDPAA